MHGTLANPWAAELMATWRGTRCEGDPRRCIVELNEVTSIDRNGEHVVKEIMSQGAEFVATGVYIKDVLGRLRTESERSERKKQDRRDDEGR